MSGDPLNESLRTRIRHLRDKRNVNADEPTAMKLRESQRTDESIPPLKEAQLESAENRIDRFANPRSRQEVVSGMSRQIPFALAAFSESDQQPVVTNSQFIREEPW